LACQLEVSVRTLRRDIERLRELGYPVQASRGVDGGYQLAPGAVLPPLVLDDDEAVALAVGLQNAAQSAVAGIAESSVRALTKVVQVMPPRLRRRVEALRAMTVSPSWTGSGSTFDAGSLVTVAQVCRDSERLEFSYTAAGGEHTERHVEPLRLVSLDFRWYLVAYDLGRHDWRSFRLHRLARLRCTGVRFRPRQLPAEDAAAFVRTGLGRLSAPYCVEVLVHASAVTVRDHVGQWGTIEDREDGRCLLRMTSDSLDWPLMTLGSLGAEFTVVSPPELLEHVHEWGHRFGRATTP